MDNELERISTFSEAPPTKNPSKSGCAANSLQFAPLTEPKRQVNDANKLVPQLHDLTRHMCIIQAHRVNIC